MTARNFAHLAVRAVSANVGLVRVAVAVFASQLEFTLDEVEEIKVAVSEAVTNAVVHAYPGQAGTVEVRAETDGEMLTVRVEDRGAGIEDVARARENGYSSDPERLGMGFYFMEELTDELEVTSHPGRGTRVVLSRRARHGAGRAERGAPVVG